MKDDSGVTPAMIELARRALTAAGLDPENVEFSDVSHDPLLLAAAQFCGAVPNEFSTDTVSLIRAAEADPLLWSIPSDLAVCLSRARMISWCFLDEGHPLTEDEKRLLRGLNAVEDPLNAIRRLKFAALDVPANDIAGLPLEKLPRSSEADQKWIADYAALVGVVKADELERTMKAVGDFFHDGLPVTFSRYLAWLSASADLPEGDEPAPVERSDS